MLFFFLGYEGTLCESNINNCQPDPCHHGTCIDGIASYTCNCDAGYTGYRCENQLNECHSNPCQNGAKCVDQVNKYMCHCQHGTSGKTKVSINTMTVNRNDLKMWKLANIYGKCMAIWNDNNGIKLLKIDD